MLSHLLLLALESRPHLTATRVREPPVLDGKLDDEAWSKAQASTGFVQKFPNEGRDPTERTTLRIVYDDEAVYVAFDCEQTQARVVQRLTRRGRLVESDWVSVAFGTRGDGKSAFEFLVNASGVRVDALRFDDTEKTEDRDQNWEAETRLTERGWAAEIKIPLHILRFPGGRERSWDLEARRYVSERQETDEWAYFPRSAAGEVSNYGKLDGLEPAKAESTLEVRPFILGKVERREPVSYLVGSGTNLGASAGLDLKWHPSHDLTLDLTMNPDFAQVEADQVVLNLSTFETFLPEKRSFFLEGTDIFTTPIQLLYTRRIGRAPSWPTIRDGEVLVAPPVARDIYAASKVTGHVADGWSVGTMQALTGESRVDVRLDDGSRTRRRVEPLTGYQVVRLRRDLGDRAYIGLTGTSTAYAESTGGYPLVGPSAGSPDTTQLCPNAVESVHPVRSLQPDTHSGPTMLASPGTRCFNNAYVGALDWRWRSPEGDWSFYGQGALSTLQGGPVRHVTDGSAIHPGDVGTAAVATLAKEGGKHWTADLKAEYFGRKFDANDVGFVQRANLYELESGLEYRELERHGPLLESHIELEALQRFNLDRLDQGSTYRLHASGKLTNFWNVWTQVSLQPRHFEDREIGDGTAIERSKHYGYEVWLESDRTKPVSFELWAYPYLMSDGQGFSFDGGLLFRVLPRLDLEILPTASFTTGERRFTGMGTTPGEYVFGRLSAKSIGTTLRATYTFTPHLTLQTYAQLFLASGHYTDFSSVRVDPGAPRPAVKLSDLRPYAGPLDNPDFLDGALNLNVVLRWEYRLGSIAYLVYTRSQAPDVTLGPGEPARIRFSSTSRGPSVDVLLFKLSYWWG